MIAYHYTSVQNFINIINTRQIWLTNVEYLNDNMECRLGLEEIMKIVSERIPNQTFIKTLTDQFYLKVLPKIFTASLSKKGDLLGQWRAYCPRDGGVAIGFKYEEMFPRAEKSTHAIINCCYEDHNNFIEQKAGKFIDEIDLSVFGKMKTNSNIDEMIDRVASIALELAAVLATTLPQLKHESFIEEQEVRVMKFQQSEVGVNFRASGDMLVPFFKMDLATADDKIVALSQIVVGPGKHQHRNIKSIERFLKCMGYKDTKVVISNCPLVV